jgi:hypothetical protein
MAMPMVTSIDPASAAICLECDMVVRPFAGMTRIRFKGWRRGFQRRLSRLPPAPLDAAISLG